MRNTADVERSAAGSPAAGNGRRKRAAQDREAQAEPVAAVESPAVAVTATRLLHIEPGLHALRVGELAGRAGAIAGMALPIAQVSAPFAEDGNGAEIVAAFPRRGPWIGREGGTVIVRSPSAGSFLIVTAYGEPAQPAVELRLDLRRLDGAALDAVAPAGLSAAAPAVALTGTHDVATEILLHIERAGDRLFPGRGWVGALGRRMRIEGFTVRPLEHLAPQEIELKGFMPSGGETPWVPGGMLCGTRARGLPLTGFAIRVVPQRADRFDVIYQGSFFAGGITEFHRNGDPCRTATGDDPLEAINIRLVERVPAPADSEEEFAEELDTAETAGRK